MVVQEMLNESVGGRRGSLSRFRDESLDRRLSEVVHEIVDGHGSE